MIADIGGNASCGARAAFRARHRSDLRAGAAIGAEISILRFARCHRIISTSRRRYR